MNRHVRVGITNFVVKRGFPPTHLRTHGFHAAQLVKDEPISLREGDTMFLECTKHTSSISWDSELSMSLHHIPDDNSCLFHAIHYVQTRTISREGAQAKRGAVADAIRSDLTTYNDAVLGYVKKSFFMSLLLSNVRLTNRMPAPAYIENLLLASTWGGHVELSVFARIYEAIILCWDVVHGLCHVIGNRDKAKVLWILTYSGIHYDVVVARSLSGLITAFDPRSYNTCYAVSEKLVHWLREQR